MKIQETQQIEKLKKENDKLKKEVAALSKRIDESEQKVQKLEKQNNELLSIGDNRELYANLKQFERLNFELEQYKRLYEQAKSRKKKVHNERGAGRKPQYLGYVDSVKKLINEQPDISTRKIAEKLDISHSTVSKIIRNMM